MRINNTRQMKLGAAITYITIIANAMVGLLVSPYILKVLGAASYGVYKTVGSLSSALVILDLGIGSTLMRYIAKYRARGENEKIGPFISLMICQAAIIIPVVVAVEAIVYCRIDHIYAQKFSAEEIAMAKQMFLVLSASVILGIVESLITGILTGYNDFVWANGTKLTKVLLRIGAVFVLLPIVKNALVLVYITLTLTALSVLTQLLRVKTKYVRKLKFAPGRCEKGVFKESFLYTLLTFLSVIAVQVNGNLDNVLVGALCGAKEVAVYSFALVIFGMFEQLSTSISGVALPTVSQLVARDSWREDTQKFIVKMGRVQFMLLGAVAVGFAVLGRQFISLWLGDAYQDVYVLTLILMVPSMFELCVNGCLTVLRAKNLLAFRTWILMISTLMNLAISVFGMSRIGYFSAALGTAASFLIGSVVVMNVYYHKKLRFRMFAIYGGIMSRTWLCLLLAGGAIIVSSHFFRDSWGAFIVNILIFAVVYGGALLAFGFRKEEKAQVLKILGKG